MAVGLARTDRPIVRLYERIHLLLPRIVDCRPIHVAAALEENGWRVERRDVCSMAGLSVELVLAHPGKAPGS